MLVLKVLKVAYLLSAWMDVDGFGLVLETG